MSRVIILLLDGVGCGELPDAAAYSDQGSNTLANLAKVVGGLSLPNLAALGLGNLISIQGVPPQEKPEACFGRMAEQSAGKDSTAGHWEVAGLVTNEPFPLFPHGFPPELVRNFEQAIGRKTLGMSPHPVRKSSRNWARSTSRPAARLSTRRRTVCCKSLATRT